MAKSAVPPETARRLADLRRELRREKLSAALVTEMNNVRWLSGFTGSDASLLVLGRTQILFTDSRYTTQAGAEAKGWTVVQARDKIRDVMERANKGGVKKLGFEPEGMTHGRYLMYRKAAGKLELKRLPDLIKKLRAVKSDPEARAIRRAADIALAAFNDTAPRARPGQTERDFALQLDTRMRELGSERLPFPTIVASGVRGALPHGVASDKKLKKGELVTVDFGAVYQGYQSDQTITFCLGKPKARQLKIYETVREAQARAIDLVRPGAVCQEVDAAARDCIREAGFGDYFGHGLGHGVGLETHEEPVLSFRSTAVLEPGMVVTVEPGIYIPGFGGVRIEDMVLVTKRGGRLLTSSSGALREM